MGEIYVYYAYTNTLSSVVIYQLLVNELTFALNLSEREEKITKKNGGRLLRVRVRTSEAQFNCAFDTCRMKLHLKRMSNWANLQVTKQ